MVKYAEISLFITLAVIMPTLFVDVTGKIIPIKKCCATDEVIDVSVMKCRNSGSNKWSPSYFKDTENEHSDEDLTDITGYEIISKIPSCPGTGVHVIPLRDLEAHSIFAAKFRLLQSGKIVAKHANGHWITVPDNSCIDGIQNFDESGITYSGSSVDQALLTCPLLEANVEDLS